MNIEEPDVSSGLLRSPSPASRQATPTDRRVNGGGQRMATVCLSDPFGPGRRSTGCEPAVPLGDGCCSGSRMCAGPSAGSSALAGGCTSSRCRSITDSLIDSLASSTLTSQSGRQTIGCSTTHRCAVPRRVPASRDRVLRLHLNAMPQQARQHLPWRAEAVRGAASGQVLVRDWEIARQPRNLLHRCDHPHGTPPSPAIRSG